MSDFERRKDQVQEAISSTAGLVGRLTAITTDAVGSAAREVGDWISDGVEMREAAKLAREDEERRTQQDADGTAGSDDTEGGP
ncbi:hypothetical protein [Dietzia timorensis]|uniref:Uncharacterized protein n=1 Tax=Dietzia timorensis TaxID=499555 RepID=A0A173LNJ8_9ACTN|nr:hypothetical protein [Dietzia timorensis]ANI93473.1 Hypothetical protein BJL86_2713 [Dietzia timorensis]